MRRPRSDPVPGDVRKPHPVPSAQCPVPSAQCPNIRSLFEAQPCASELAAAVQRPDLCDDFLGVGESLPSEAADPPALRFE